VKPTPHDLSIMDIFAKIIKSKSRGNEMWTTMIETLT
jgi:hypothetical protein